MRIVEELVFVDFAHQPRQAGGRVRPEEVQLEDLGDVAIGLKEVFLEDKLASVVHHISFGVHQETSHIDFPSSAVHEMTVCVIHQHGVARSVDLVLSQNSANVEPAEGEDLGELTLIQMGLVEQDSALAGADASFFVDDVTRFVNHEASLVHEDILTSLVFASQFANAAIFVAIKDAHDLLNLKSFALVVVHLWHEASERFELASGEDLAATLVDQVSLLVMHKALQSDLSAQLVVVFALLLSLVEGERIIKVVIEEGTQHVEGIEVKPLEIERHRDLSLLVKVSSLEDHSSTQLVNDVSSLWIDEATMLVYGPPLPIN